MRSCSRRVTARSRSTTSRPITIREKLKIMLQMAAVLTYGATLPVVKVGRIAGQFAKPRSSPDRAVGGVELPSFRGHIVNDDAADAEARTPDPDRMVSGLPPVGRDAQPPTGVHEGRVRRHHPGARVEPGVRRQLARGAAVRGARRRDRAGAPLHGGLRHRPRVEPPAARGRRLDEPRGPDARLRGGADAPRFTDGRLVRLLGSPALDRRAHAPPEGAHVGFFAGVHNPLGVKLGPAATADEPSRSPSSLNPDRVPGRLTFVTRMGADRVPELLPPLLRAVREAGHPVVWACDPMHANTVKTGSGVKTRHFDDDHA